MPQKYHNLRRLKHRCTRTSHPEDANFYAHTSMARYTGAGTRVTSETMAVDVIDDVGPGGNYITHPHTAKHFREEIWQPHTFIRYMWDQWEAKGKKSCFDLAKDRVHDVLAQHQPVPLSDDACVKMNETISRRQSECED
jgi:trimethylamine--corrinoid protein Co-methyltransferase